MPGKDYRYGLTADDKLSGPVEKAAQTVRRSTKAMADGADEVESAFSKLASGITSDLNRAATEAEQFERAVDAVSDALGPEFVAKVGGRGEIEGVVASYNRAGIALNEIEQEAEQAAASIREIDSAMDRAGRAVQTIDDGTRSMRQFGEETTQNRSVVANFAGNIGGELAPAFGPLNVAMGQFLEYSAEGQINLKKFIAAGLGIGAVTALVIGMKGAIDKVNAGKALNREHVDDFTDALREGEDAATALAARLEETGKLEFGFGDLGKQDIAPQIAELGLTVQQFSTLAGSSRSTIDEWYQSMLAAGAGGGALDMVMLGLVTTHGNLAAAEENVALQTRLLGEEQSGAAVSTEELAAQQEALGTVADGVRTAIDGVATAIRELNGEQLSGLEANAAYQEAVDALTESVETNGFTLDDNTEAGRANLAAAVDAAAALNELIARRFEETGSIEQATAAGVLYVENLRAQLDQAGWTEEQIQTYIDTLGLTPEEVSTNIALAGTEQAMVFLSEHQAALDALPEEEQTWIRALLDQGAFAEAERSIAALTRRRELVITARMIGDTFTDIFGKSSGGKGGGAFGILGDTGAAGDIFGGLARDGATTDEVLAAMQAREAGYDQLTGLLTGFLRSGHQAVASMLYDLNPDAALRLASELAANPSLLAQFEAGADSLTAAEDRYRAIGDVGIGEALGVKPRGTTRPGAFDQSRPVLGTKPMATGSPSTSAIARPNVGSDGLLSVLETIAQASRETAANTNPTNTVRVQNAKDRAK